MRIGVAAAIAALAAGTLAGQEARSVDELRVVSHDAAAPSGDVVVSSQVSQTALWPGDLVTRELEIRCAPEVDVLAEDLEADELTLAGLEVVSSERDRTTGPEGVIYRVRYQLTTYELDAGPLAIGDQTIRYYVRRPGQRVEDAAPAGEVRVPGVSLALRSTLPDELTSLQVRDRRPAASLPPLAARAGGLGLALVLLSGLPVALWAAPFVPRFVAAVRRRRTRRAKTITRDALEELRDVDASSEEARRAGFDRLDATLRRHLVESAGLPADALTAVEIGERLPASAPRLPAEQIAAVLEDCERARYGRQGQLPPPERFEAGVRAVAELLGR